MDLCVDWGRRETVSEGVHLNDLVSGLEDLGSGPLRLDPRHKYALRTREGKLHSHQFGLGFYRSIEMLHAVK